MAETQNTFKCVLISPAGKLLDCKASSIIFTARDGSMGVLYNHTPMLCELGVGFMEITGESESNGSGHKKIFVDRGFALISSNLVNIIADDAICMWNTTKERIELIQKLLGHNLNSKTYLTYIKRKINFTGTKHDI